MAKQINIIANLIDKQLKKQLQALQNGKYNINVNVNNANVGQTSNQVHQLSRSANSANTAFGKLGSTITETFSTSRMTMTAFLAVMNEIRKAGKNAQQTIQDLDKAITDLSIATNMSREDTAKLVKNYNDYAKELKSTTVNITSAADDWLRAGKSMNETQTLIKDSIMLSKLGQIDSGAATEDLLATANGFNMSVEEVGRALDSMVSIDMKAATSAGDLATGLKYSASSASAAGVSFNKLVAILGTVQDKTMQSSEIVGTFANTMLSRYRDITINKYLSDDGDDISNYESVLKSIGIELRNSQGEFRDFETVLEEMAGKWNYLSSTEQNALIKVAAGTRQQNRFIALMEGYNKVLELTEVAANSAGTAVEKFNNSYTNSLEAQKNNLQASFESMIVNSDMDSVYSGILDATTALVEFIDKTNALKGVFAGLATSTALKFFVSAKTGAKEAYLSLNQFSNALKIVKQTNIPTGDFDRLLLLSKNLSSSQMKLLLSSKNLTLAQKEQILVNSGLSAEEAKLQLQTWGMATAQNGLTVATTSLANAFCGLIASMVANPIILLTTVISGAVMAYQSYTQKIEEARQKNIEAGNAAKENADSLRELYLQYEQLNGITNKTESQEEQFKQAVIDITKALANKASALEGLTAGTDDYTEALKNATKAELESQYATAKIGAKAAEEELQSAAYSKWSGSKITIQQNEQMTGVEEHMAALNAVKDILKEYETLGMVGDATVLEWKPIGFDQNPDDMKAVVEYYQALIQARDKLVTADNADFLMSSDIYKDINTTINDLSDSVEKYTEQQYQALKLQYEWQNGIPTTEEEFKNMETSILNASGAGKEFQSILKGYLNEDFATFSESTNSINDMADAVDNATQSISNIKSFSDAWEELKVSTDDSTKKLADNLTELAESGRLTAETFSQTDTSGYFENLGISADDAVKQINSLVDSATQLQSMSAQISKMSDMLADKKNGTTASASDLAGFDATVKGLESWAEFERVMGSSKSSMEECQAAANALATEWVNNGNFLENLTEENKQYYVTQLDNMGVENADAVVTEVLGEKKVALSLKEQALAITKGEVTSKSADEVNALLNEANASDTTREYLFQLVSAEQAFNNTSLDVSGKIAKLGELASAYGQTAIAAKIAASNAGNEAGHTQGSWSAADLKHFQDEITASINTPIKIKPTGSQNYKPTGSTSKNKNAKEKPKTGLVDFYEKKINSLNNQLDVLGEKYENIFSVKKKKDNLDEQIDKLKELSKVSDTAAKRYRKQADKITFFKDSKKDAEFKEKIRNGSYNITRYDQDTINKIQRYEDYIGKAEDAESQSRTAKTQEREKQKDKNQLDIDTAQQRKDWLDAEIENTGNSEKKIRLLKKQRTEIGKIYDGEIANAELEHNSVKVKELQAEKQKELTDNTISQYQLDADNAEAKIAKSQALAALDEGNYKKQNKHLEGQRKYLREQYDAQIKIAEAEGNTLEVERLRAELLKELRDNTKEQFDNIVNTYDNQVGLNNNKIKAFQDQISLLEAKGQQVGSALYTKQMTLNNLNEKKLVAEREKLIKKLNEIPKGTDDWYAAQDTLFSVESDLVNIQIENANLQKSINQLKFDRFDDLLDKLNDIVDETNFLKDMLSDNLFDDNGMITDDGVTAMGLTAQNYDVYLAEAQRYKEQMAELERDYQNGIVDPETYEAKMREYKDGQQDMIKSANDVKKSLVSLVKEGLDAQNQALEREIENRKKLLSQQKESRDFNRKMLDLDKEIARTERQLAVLNSGADDSEENRKTIRELKSKLEDLKQDRDDTIYDKSIEQQEQALDDLVSASKEKTEEYLKDSNKVFIDALDYVNAHTTQISSNLEKISSDLGYDISTNITDAWKDGGKAVDSYENILKGNVPKVTAQIGLITSAWKEAALAAEKAAKAMAKATTSEYQKHTGAGSGSSDSGNTTNPKEDEYNNYQLQKQIGNYLLDNTKEAKSDPKSYSSLNQYIYEKTGKILPEDKQAGLAKILGITGVGKNTSADDRAKILKALKAAKFSSGGVIDAKNLIRQTGEDGIALVKHEEAVLTKPEWQSIRDLGIALTNLNQQIYKPYIPEFQTRNVQPISNNININTTVEGVATDKIVKDFENVATKSVEKAFSKVNNISYTSKNISRR